MKPFLLAGLAVLSAACGRDKTLPATVLRTRGILSEDQAARLIGDFGPSIALLGSRFDGRAALKIINRQGQVALGLSRPALGSDARAFVVGDTPLPLCAKLIEGSSADEDSDGLPLLAKVSANCVDEQRQLEFKGAFSAEDKNDANIFGGYRLAFATFSIWDLTPGRVWGLELDGSMSLSVGANYFLGDYALRLKTQNVHGFEKLGYFVQVQAVPDDRVNPERSGELRLFGGHFSYENADGVDVVLAISAQGLLYSEGCPEGSYREGSLVFTDGVGNFVRYAFDRCELSASYNDRAFALVSSADP